ncbi:MAG: cytochrome-c peroxidase [Deltaproteobacteria bacterium]|nr:cytochrome-c peroxidase [Deltaproteobacteria bacterium]
MRRSEGPTIGLRGAIARLALGLLVIGLVAGCSDQKGSEATSSSSTEPATAPTSPEAAPAAEATPSAADPAIAALAEKANTILKPLPTSAPNPENEGTQAKIDLGRMLYYDTRLSKNHDLSCNSCHQLDKFGVDNEPTSPGHKGARGDRNSPTVYNAALHIAQFWDGRAADVEAQAKGPVLNPVEMAMPSDVSVEAILDSIPGYASLFAAAFPGEADPITYDNMARAIGAFERNLMTPGRLDAFMGGDLAALSEQERRGLETFFAVGCNSCHTGPALGGQLYRKLGFVFAYYEAKDETKDPGREKVTADPADRHVFKVPSLRNVAKTGPWFHDGSITSLEEAVRLMGYHQVGLTLEPAQIADLVAFLGALTGEVDAAYVAKPTLPESGPNTPKPDPS